MLLLNQLKIFTKSWRSTNVTQSKLFLVGIRTQIGLNVVAQINCQLGIWTKKLWSDFSKGQTLRRKLTKCVNDWFANIERWLKLFFAYHCNCTFWLSSWIRGCWNFWSVLIWHRNVLKDLKFLLSLHRFELSEWLLLFAFCFLRFATER